MVFTEDAIYMLSSGFASLFTSSAGGGALGALARQGVKAMASKDFGDLSVETLEGIIREDEKSEKILYSSIVAFEGKLGFFATSQGGTKQLLIWNTNVEFKRKNLSHLILIPKEDVIKALEILRNKTRAKEMGK